MLSPLQRNSPKTHKNSTYKIQLITGIYQNEERAPHSNGSEYSHHCHQHGDDAADDENGRSSHILCAAEDGRESILLDDEVDSNGEGYHTKDLRGEMVEGGIVTSPVVTY